MHNHTHFTSGNRYPACILLLLLIVLCLLPACRDHSTGPEPLPSIQLDVDYRGTDFVWLKLSVEETVKDLHYLIRRNNEDRFTGQFSGRDTLITDRSLTPGTGTLEFFEMNFRYTQFFDLPVITVISENNINQSRR